MYRDATVVTCDYISIAHTGKGIKWLSIFYLPPPLAPKPLPENDAMIHSMSYASLVPRLSKEHEALLTTYLSSRQTQQSGISMVLVCGTSCMTLNSLTLRLASSGSSGV